MKCQVTECQNVAAVCNLHPDEAWKKRAEAAESRANLLGGANQSVIRDFVFAKASHEARVKEIEASEACWKKRAEAAETKIAHPPGSSTYCNLCGAYVCCVSCCADRAADRDAEIPTANAHARGLQAEIDRLEIELTEEREESADYREETRGWKTAAELYKDQADRLQGIPQTLAVEKNAEVCAKFSASRPGVVSCMHCNDLAATGLYRRIAELESMERVRERRAREDADQLSAALMQIAKWEREGPADVQAWRDRALASEAEREKALAAFVDHRRQDQDRFATTCSSLENSHKETQAETIRANAAEAAYTQVELERETWREHAATFERRALRAEAKIPHFTISDGMCNTCNRPATRVRKDRDTRRMQEGASEMWKSSAKLAETLLSQWQKKCEALEMGVLHNEKRGAARVAQAESERDGWRKIAEKDRPDCNCHFLEADCLDDTGHTENCPSRNVDAATQTPSFERLWKEAVADSGRARGERDTFQREASVLKLAADGWKSRFEALAKMPITPPYWEKSVADANLKNEQAARMGAERSRDEAKDDLSRIRKIVNGEDEDED